VKYGLDFSYGLIHYFLEKVKVENKQGYSDHSHSVTQKHGRSQAHVKVLQITKCSVKSKINRHNEQVQKNATKFLGS